MGHSEANDSSSEPDALVKLIATSRSDVVVVAAGQPAVIANMKPERRSSSSCLKFESRHPWQLPLGSIPTPCQRQQLSQPVEEDFTRFGGAFLVT